MENIWLGIKNWAKKWFGEQNVWFWKKEATEDVYYILVCIYGGIYATQV